MYSDLFNPKIKNEKYQEFVVLLETIGQRFTMSLWELFCIRKSQLFRETAQGVQRKVVQ